MSDAPRLSVEFRLPWWWRFAVFVAQVMHANGIEVDAERAARFVVSHGHLKAKDMRERDDNRHVGALVAVAAFVLIALLSCSPADAQAVSPRARAYLFDVARESQRQFGPNAPVATMMAQLHQESAFRPDARSPVGAQGLAQFRPATAADMAKRWPAALAPANPLDPGWAIKAQAYYMATLLRQASFGATACDRWAFALSGYNGGMLWAAQRDRAEGARRGVDSTRWFGHVERTPDQRRSPAAIRENRGYPQRILLVLSPVYARAGMGSAVVCEVPR